MKMTPFAAACAATLCIGGAAHSSTFTGVELRFDFTNTEMEDLTVPLGDPPLFFDLEGTIEAFLSFESAGPPPNLEQSFIEVNDDPTFGTAEVSGLSSFGDYESNYEGQGSFGQFGLGGAFEATGFFIQSSSGPFGLGQDEFVELSVALGLKVLGDLVAASAGDTFTYDAGTDVFVEEYLWDDFNFLRGTEYAVAVGGTVDIEVLDAFTVILPPTPIPLPAGLPLAVAGVGALALVRRFKA